MAADEIEGGSDTPTQYNGQGCRLGNTSDDDDDDDDDNGDYDGDDGGDDDDDSFVCLVITLPPYNSHANPGAFSRPHFTPPKQPNQPGSGTNNNLYTKT